MSETTDWIKQSARDARTGMGDWPHDGETIRQAIEAAMLSVAARVERETREADAEVARAGDNRLNGPVKSGMARAIVRRILAIPAKYQEPSHE